MHVHTAARMFSIGFGHERRFKPVRGHHPAHQPSEQQCGFSRSENIACMMEIHFKLSGTIFRDQSVRRQTLLGGGLQYLIHNGRVPVQDFQIIILRIRKPFWRHRRIAGLWSGLDEVELQFRRHDSPQPQFRQGLYIASQDLAR